MYWALNLLYALLGPWQTGWMYPLTNYLSAINGPISFLVMLVVYMYYSACGLCRSTVILCIAKTWYKVILCVSDTLMLGIVVIISALETR
ncbi:hypothetical protein MFIFM68171_07238 [Madurella fahalii]|uniref:Uncharacterized protein n=1 Tax=Madurella fahalii TaxID=1157608 RepID=A0ABQ0GGZ7_9PEZI